ncbi:S41 family peptidase [Litorimonas sp. WD9-15]|uniref:S41 family peptidase n=1 Tax=Litorimonas sp. WD9-15 TaxID=3418716 RepID=UPI003D016D30
MTLRHLLLGTVFTALGTLTSHATETGYYMQPDLQGSEVVFSSEGDIWAAGVEGGPAVRLTTHVEVERDPVLSPDGEWLAFTANYDGASEAWVMPVTGGAPKQLTHEAGGVSVKGWTPDGHVIIQSRKAPGPRATRIRMIDPESGEIETLPLDGATDAVVAEDGTIVFTRYGLSMSRDNAKLYRGGTMAQLWTYDPVNKIATRLLEDFDAPLRDPMISDGRIIFVSDKSGSDNFWGVNMDGLDPVEFTALSDWQIRGPRMDGDNIVFQWGADIAVLDMTNSDVDILDIELVTDNDPTRTWFIEDPLNFLSSTDMSADGKAAVLTARGRVTVAFPGQRRRVDIAIPGEARARAATLSNDGKDVFVILDQGEQGEIWRYAADGRGEGEQLTDGSEHHIWSLHPSPDDETLIYQDKAGHLHSLNIESGRKKKLATTGSDDDYAFRNITFSQGGRYVAFTGSDQKGLSQLELLDVKSGDATVLAGGKYAAYSPAFSADGGWLYFISDRNFRSNPSGPWGERVPGPAFDKRGQLYAVQLDPEADFPFTAKTELDLMEEDKDEEKTPDSEDEKDEDAAPKEMEIEFDGLDSRIWPVPVSADNYYNLSANKSHLYVMSEGNLKTIAISDLKPEMKTFQSGVANYELSADGKTVFTQTRGNEPTLALLPAGAEAPKDMSEHTLRIKDWRPGLTPQAEWTQMVRDAWRLHRDFAYDPSLRGVDWDAVLDKYLPLTERIAHRNEVNDLLGQMASELGILHSQIGTGDQENDDATGQAAALGAELSEAPNGVRIDRILDGERDLFDQLGPLLKPGVDVQNGDVIMAVDGRPVSTPANLHAALQHKAGQEVRLDFERNEGRFLRRATEMSAIVTPVSSGRENRLRYHDWVQTNREKVAEMSGGEIGYLHLRAMGGGDVASFTRDFGEHLDKDGLIIDVRGNNGGNVDSFIIAALLKKAWAFWDSPGPGAPTSNMQGAFRGHLAVLIDEGTYSDGETFAAGVKALDLGPLIGTQTAGAGIWLSDRNRLVDGGVARIGEYAQYSADGSWMIEGKGVAPDIEVENPPIAAFEGEDAQMKAAIDYLEEKIESDPIPELKPKPLPELGGYGTEGR